MNPYDNPASFAINMAIAVERSAARNNTSALVSALYELARHVDEDVPLENRSRHLNNALAYAFELAEAFEETPTQPI